jgi:asparagine synthase (glutamine-hydrolysing)
MCGISGILRTNTAGRAFHGDAIARDMADAMAHRGPDSSGTWMDEEGGVALGHRRLAILDLSPLGHQPMVSSTGRYVIVFNGEIFNFRQLAGELRGRARFNGASDTEVMLAAIEAYGLPAAVCRFVGMFAFALWDRDTASLHLVRDRLGIKPLYYGRVGGSFAFASELKGFHALAGFDAEIDRDALALLLRHNCIPAPHSIFRGICKLMPGTILTLTARTADAATPVPYWSAREVAERGLAHPFAGTDADATNALEALLREAVQLRMVADVPLGAFLSGGIDSSTVVALMQAQSDRPVRTFSIGSPDPGYNEAHHAREVARYLGTDHTELYVTPDDALAVIPALPTIYDEPFADSSQIPTFLVSTLARQHVTVSLSGDGGDELFGGYTRHMWGNRVWSAIRRTPVRLRHGFARALETSSPKSWDRGYDAVERLIPARFRQQMFGYKMNKLASALMASDSRDLYQRLASHWFDAQSVVIGASCQSTAFAPGALAGEHDFREQMMYMDLVTYLPDDILAKLDRASMAVSLEARVPLLDHRVVEFAWQLPLHMKIRAGQGKWLLRQVLHRHVPAKLVERPKTGFGVPLDSWLRGPLRDWAEQLLDERRLRDEGFFHPGPIRERWAQHLSGRASWQYHLWDVLTFQAWLEAQHGSARSTRASSTRGPRAVLA